ncbi:response regulator transcription factor [Microbacterium sp. AZCO]|uniref:response regulator transcription factor n=1 Tax=Microbacterium sp. AZCO TaxID=3142976 RepID=UPI0031F3A25C
MSDPDAVRILLVDDQALIRVGFRMMLDAEPGFAVVGEAADGAQAVADVDRLRPDVVLMDVRMPGMDGIAATAEIVRRSPSCRVLVLTTFDLDEYAFGAIRAGAAGFLLKDAERVELISAIRAVHAGEATLTPRVTRRMLELMTEMQESPARPDLDALTEREQDVLAAIARGLTNSEIASELFLSESTVKTHVGRVLTKLPARDRVHAVLIAHGLATPEAGGGDR